MLKWTGALAAAAAVVGVGAGYEANQLLRPITTVTQTATQTVPLIEEQVFPAVTASHTSSSAEAIMRVHVRNGRIAWVDPLQLTADEANSTWKITVGGKTYSAASKLQPSPLGMALRSRTYSPDRVLYPMKRIGYVPGGGGDVSNRGKGEFVRITWQEAYDLVANEMRRVQQKYGQSAVGFWANAHLQAGVLHNTSTMTKFFLNFGGFTDRDCEGHTWTTWTYGGSFIWGYCWIHGQADQTDLLFDIMKNSKMVVFWGTEPTTTETPYGGHESANWRFWWKELGIKMIQINPIQGDTAALYCDQWVPIIPGTDTAMALAIANVWIKEGTYDKDFVATHTVGFDKFSDYVLGKKDGPDGMVDRTPDWAAKITGVPAATITSLAREWASKPTALSCYDSGLCRSSFGYEWARMMVALQAMQGVGKPGVSLSHGCQKRAEITPMDKKWIGIPSSITTLTDSTRGTSGKASAAHNIPPNPVKQTVHQQNMPECFLTDFTKNPPLKWRGGTGLNGWRDPSECFVQHTYPMPGFSEVHLLYRFGGAGGYGMLSPDPNSNAKAYQSPKIESFFINAPRFDAESVFADIILPACDMQERNDLSVSNNMGSVAVYQRAAVEPLGQSLTDYQIMVDLANRLGFADTFTEGNTEDDWLRKCYEMTSYPLSWEDFKAKGYQILPMPKDYTPAPSMKWFYDKPGAQITGPSSGLSGTPSGKIEFQSKTLTDFYGEHSTAVGDVPKYFVNPHGRWSPLAKKYPLQINAQHSKYRDHTKAHSAPFLYDIYKYNGYEPADMNPVDADARGIKEKDIVRIFNDTGQILAYAHLTERIVPGVVHVAWGSMYRPVQLGNTATPDAGRRV